MLWEFTKQGNSFHFGLFFFPVEILLNPTNMMSMQAYMLTRLLAHPLNIYYVPDRGLMYSCVSCTLNNSSGALVTQTSCECCSLKLFSSVALQDSGLGYGTKAWSLLCPFSLFSLFRKIISLKPYLQLEIYVPCINFASTTYHMLLHLLSS